MIQLLAPVFLLGLTALAIPVVIHLWSRRAGKTIKVGTIQFLKASDSRRFRSVKLQDPLLLFVRAMLITLLVLLLAKPFFFSRAPAEVVSQAGWILLEPEIVSRGLDAPSLRRIDSLAVLGNEVRLLSSKFPRISLDDSVSLESDADYWSLLWEADAVAPIGIPFWVLTSNRLSGFRGKRPTLTRVVEWTMVGAPGQNRWIEEARVLPGDSLRLVVGVSDTFQTKFIRHDGQLPQAGTSLSVDRLPTLGVAPAAAGEGTVIKLVGNDLFDDDNHLTLDSERAPRNALICYDESRKEDATYVRLAVESVLEFTNRLGVVKSRLIDQQAPAVDGFDWVIWLSDGSLPAHLQGPINSGVAILTDSNSADYAEVHTELVSDRLYHGSSLRFFRRVDAHGRGYPLWNDAFGQPLLEIERKGSSWHMQFHSRFHPLWNDLPSHPSFPELIMLTMGFTDRGRGAHTAGTPSSDRRMIDGNQVLPNINIEIGDQTTSGKPESRRLDFPIWLAALAAFCVDRWLSERKVSA